jgi:hypothetical protein
LNTLLLLAVVVLVAVVLALVALEQMLQDKLLAVAHLPKQD